MSLAYTAPTWTDGSGTGISAAQLQAISDCIEGLVQGSDKAIHAFALAGSIITVTYADGSQETFSATGLKGIATIEKTATVDNVDTYTITFTDGSTSTYDITNGTAPDITVTATADATSSATPTVTVTKSGTEEEPIFAMAFSGLKGAQGETGQTGPAGADGDDGVSPTVSITTITGGHRVTITDADHPSGQSFDVMDGSGTGDMQASVYDPQSAVATAGGIPAYVDEQCDEWFDTVSPVTVSSGAFTFSGLDDTQGWGFEPWVDVDDNSTNKNPSCEITSITGAGTSNMSIAYSTNADEGATVHMRIIK